MNTAESKGQQQEPRAPSGYYKDVPPIDPRVLHQVWEGWEPERPELLVRLRPRRAPDAAQ
jgi:hypothetical protein